MMSRLVRCVDVFLRGLLVLLMLAMLIDVVWQVLSRYLLQAPSSITEEIARYLLIWITFLGGSYAYRRRLHLGIDLLAGKMSPTHQLYLRWFSYLMCALFALLVLVVGGANLTILAFELKQYSGALGMPIGYLYCVVPLSGVLIIFYSLYFLMTDSVAEKL